MVMIVVAALIVGQGSRRADAAGGCTATSALDVVTCLRSAPEGFGTRPLDPYMHCQCAEAYILIDKHLRSKVRGDDLQRNLKEVQALLKREEDAMGDKMFGYFKRKLCLSELLRSKDRWAMLTALNVLASLRGPPEPAHQCFVYATQNLADANYIAGNPLARRTNNGTDLLPRIDSLIFNLAVQRAELCLPRYRHQLTDISPKLHNEFLMMNSYFNRVIEYRMQRQNFAHGRLHSILAELPEQAIRFVRRMPYAFESDDIHIALEMFRYQGASSSSEIRQEEQAGTDWRLDSFDAFIRRPCFRYIDMASNVMESIEFYLKVKAFLSNELLMSSVYDRDVGKMRAYYLMCTKAVKEESRFLEIVAARGEQ